jgi:hypothetical protein
MRDVPLEVLLRHSAREVGNYFGDKVYENRKNGRVAILVEDFTNSLYFMPCNEHGYPDFHSFNFMTYQSLSTTVMNEGEYDVTSTSTVEEVSIMIEKPMLTQRYNWEDRPYVFLWSGKIMSKRKIPLEKLNVSELLKLAQQAVLNREGLVIDEALRNKIYK